MTPSPVHAVITCVALVASTAALAQSGLDAAQARYERTMAYCNGGNLPRPQRDACVRDAGMAWDRAQRGLPPLEDVTSPGGRAVVVVPRGAPPPLSDSDTVTSPDGDSTIVLPADGSRPLAQ
ncbi:hypothetical protein QTI33_23335 [Variovorax sp. J22P271]|uniref:hypothetical protein n=1 Tax=Variovorax davisae TaxID=3053515 RepID=UPI0025787004|nr:hypothetical protein [Variovorax sp. J22P271]MDM0035087.1 hypothetical protein [Variovorax sp. J22P271]